MTTANNIKRIWNLLSSIEVLYTETLLDDLRLSEKLKDCEEKSPNKPPFAINYLEYYNSPEPVTSWIIRHIFAYTYNGHHLFFESFAKTFLQKAGFNMDWIDTPVIDKDHEYKGIDILIRDKHYAIIIENKLKGAQFQLNQLARYIATMRKEGYSDDQIFVVVLPKDDVNNDDLDDSVWQLPKDWQCTNSSRKCRVDSYTCWCDNEDFKRKAHCEKCESLKESFRKRTLFIHKELSEWLYNCIENNTVCMPEEELHKQYVLKSAVLQFIDFLNFLYKTRENNKYKMDINKFLSEQLKLNNLDIKEQLSMVEDKQKDVNELAEQLDSLYWTKIKEYITYIGNKYKVHLDKDDGDYYFHCELKYESTPFWVVLGYENSEKKDFCQIESKTRSSLPNYIKNDFEIAEELNDKKNTNRIIWKYDSYKESLLRFERVLERLIDIINDAK